MAQAIYRRLSEVNAAADYEHAAELRKFPNLLAVEQAPAIIPAETVLAALTANEVSSKAAGNVINFAEKRLTHEENEQRDRVVQARLALEEAHNDIAA